MSSFVIYTRTRQGGGHSRVLAVSGLMFLLGTVVRRGSKTDETAPIDERSILEPMHSDYLYLQRQIQLQGRWQY
jgi:hypothetical protein